jgi:hypothetical protein
VVTAHSWRATGAGFGTVVAGMSFSAPKSVSLLLGNPPIR